MADVRPICFSATELQSCKELIDFAMKEYGQVDILINNVGGTDPKRDLGIEKLDINYFDEVFHLNLCCTMYLSQQVIPIMVAHGGGNIVNVASISGMTADANITYIIKIKLCCATLLPPRWHSRAMPMSQL